MSKFHLKLSIPVPFLNEKGFFRLLTNWNKFQNKEDLWDLHYRKYAWRYQSFWNRTDQKIHFRRLSYHLRWLWLHLEWRKKGRKTAGNIKPKTIYYLICGWYTWKFWFTKRLSYQTMEPRNRTRDTSKYSSSNARWNIRNRWA